MGQKILSNDQEKQMIEEYINGMPVNSLLNKYGFLTEKSISDKIKKYYPEDQYNKIVESARNNRKNYTYSFEKIKSPFDAYFLGLLLTDGYITSRGTDIGLDLIDEDCISFLANTIGVKYHKYCYNDGIRQDRYRLILSNPTLVAQIKRLGIVPKKTLDLSPPNLYPEEEKYIPYIIRGIIDGDGSVSPTSYNAPQFYIVTMSEKFANWCIYILENKMYMTDIHKRQNNKGLWRIETADCLNILKLITLSYNEPFGMSRKYELLRQTFNDYNRDSFIK